MAHGTVLQVADVERFPAVVQFEQMLRPLVPLLIVFLLFGWAIFTLLLMMVMGPPPGLLLASASTAAGGWYLYRSAKQRFDQAWSGTALELSSSGIAVADHYVRTEMAWPGVQEIIPLTPINPLPVDFGSDVAEIVAAGSAPATPRVEGLIGVGSTTVSPDAPTGTRSPLVSYDLPRNIQTVALTHFDPDWRRGRIGQWVRAYRPDLLS